MPGPGGEAATVKSILVTTMIPSPYQVEFFNELAQAEEYDFHAAYLQTADSQRHWDRQPIHHAHTILEGDEVKQKQVRQQAGQADLVVFGWYRDRFMRRLMAERAAAGKPWVFWGERPGSRLKGPLGRWYRRVALAPLHRQPVPIWGIGEWALEMWRREFGPNRLYENVPYFSNLHRYLQFADIRRGKFQRRTILFSGSLIERKGVDLLAQTFRDLAPDFPQLRLVVLGDGPMMTSMKRTLHGCREQVEFLGFRDWAELPRFYHAADFLCAPSRHDGWGMIVPEGLAAGMPVIATDHMGAARDLVEPGRNGWLLPADSLEPLEQALHEAVTLEPQRLEEMSRAALEKAQTHTLVEGRRRFFAAARRAMGDQA